MNETQSKPGVRSSEFWIGGGIAGAITQAPEYAAWPLAFVAVGYALARAFEKGLRSYAALRDRRSPLERGGEV